MFSEQELEFLKEALGEYMSDEYGHENEEGCWSPEQWENLQRLADKLNTIRRESASKIIGRCRNE